MGSNGTSDIFVLGVDLLLGDGIINASLDAKRAEEGPVMMAVSVYEASLLNISEGILICLATALVALGAYFSTTDLEEVHSQDSLGSALTAPQEEVLEIDQWSAIGFFFVGS